MRVSKGEVVYRIAFDPCLGIGLSWSIEEMDAAINGPVSSVLFDDSGREIVATLLTGLAETNFAQEALRRIFEYPEEVEDWRVGEAIAEVYLREHRSCFFPWPDERDVRKRKSSLPGADLVGIGRDVDGDCFVFGEVKTSSENHYPPRSMYGGAGLKQQIKNLRDRRSIRNSLVQYMAFRANGASWQERFKNALRRYLRNNADDVQLFGFLVRDIEPNKNDLSASVEGLATGCPERMRIELLALYLPQGRINGIGRRATTSRRMGSQP